MRVEMRDGQSAHNCLSPKRLGEKDPIFVHVKGLHVMVRFEILTVLGFQIMVSREGASKPFQYLLGRGAKATALYRIRMGPWPKKKRDPNTRGQFR